MVGAQAIGLLGGALALVVMAKVSSSGFTDAGGPAAGSAFDCPGLWPGAVGTTVLGYTVVGYMHCKCPRAAKGLAARGAGGFLAPPALAMAGAQTAKVPPMSRLVSSASCSSSADTATPTTGTRVM